MKPRIGIFGLSGCWGEQIVILNCEDQLLDLVEQVDIVDCRAASSVNDADSPLAVAFVEGSVGSAREEAALKRIRERAQLLVACGTCACIGGIAAGLTGPRRTAAAQQVYGDAAPGYDLTPHRPLRDFVKVDASIPGCPMEKEEFLQAVACLVNGDLPEPVTWPVCAECRMREQECLLLTYGVHCSGPVTTGGCGARCPGHNVPCIGCRGPVDEANFDSMQTIVARAGVTAEAFRARRELFGCIDAPPSAATTEDIHRQEAVK